MIVPHYLAMAGDGAGRTIHDIGDTAILKAEGKQDLKVSELSEARLLNKASMKKLHVEQKLKMVAS